MATVLSSIQWPQSPEFAYFSSWRSPWGALSCLVRAICMGSLAISGLFWGHRASGGVVGNAEMFLIDCLSPCPGDIEQTAQPQRPVMPMAKQAFFGWAGG